MQAPIKRGTARRLGLELPAAELVMHLEFDVDRLKRHLAAMRFPPLLRWQAQQLDALFCADMKEDR